MDVSASLTPPLRHEDHARTAYLDGWRGVSILLVLVGHFIGLPAIRWGQLGVELFFALSGRLMAQILFVDGFPLRQFFARRFSRVWPGLLALVLMLMALTSYGWPTGEAPIDAGTGLSVLTFTIGYLRGVLVPGSGSLDHIWSLAIEEHAYVILALIAVLARRYRLRPAPIMLAIALLSIAAGETRSVVLGQDYYAAYWVTDSRLASIFLPALLFLERERLIGGLGRLAPMAPLVAGASGMLLHYHLVPDALRYSAGPLLFGIAIVTLPCASGWLIALLQLRVLRWLGLMSFSVYLWQQPFMVASQGLGSPGRLICLAGALLAGMASYHLVETPCRRVLNARFGRPDKR